VSRSDIVVGLTLAEIALALLFSFLALFIPAYARLNRKLKLYSAVDVYKLQNDLKSATVTNETLRAEIDKSRRNLRSAAIPACAELNSSDWVFTAIIRGSDIYEVNGNKYSLNGILQTYATELSEAKKNGCRHRVKVYYDRNVSLLEYDSALRRVEQYFYDLKLGAEP
jgi:hypothetical protein